MMVIGTRHIDDVVQVSRRINVDRIRVIDALDLDLDGGVLQASGRRRCGLWRQRRQLMLMGMMVVHARRRDIGHHTSSGCHQGWISNRSADLKNIYIYKVKKGV